jgi:hypothetical protein
VSAILDAIDQELAVARERVTQLEELRDRASAIDGAVSDVPQPESEGGGIGDPPPKRRRRRQKRTEKPKSSRQSQRGITNRKRGEQHREAILAYVRETGGAQVKEIAEATGLDPQVVRQQAKNLVSQDSRGLRVEILGSGGPTSPRLYRPAESDIAPADGNGARTGLERRVVEAISGVELTESEIAANTEIPEHRVREVLAGLCRRGVLTREGKLYGVAA